MNAEIKIILASQSPRRRDLLNQLGVKFVCEPTDADETLDGAYLPDEAVRILSARKAAACLEKHTGENVFVIKQRVLRKCIPPKFETRSSLKPGRRFEIRCRAKWKYRQRQDSANAG